MTMKIPDNPNKNLLYIHEGKYPIAMEIYKNIKE